jgi:hypothetical protein
MTLTALHLSTLPLQVVTLRSFGWCIVQVIDNSSDFKAKLARVTTAVCDLVGIHPVPITAVTKDSAIAATSV